MRIEEEFIKCAENVFEKAEKEKRLILNPSPLKPRQMMIEKEKGVKTKYGNIVVRTEPTSRAARFTKNSIDYPFGEDEQKLIQQCTEILSKERLIVIDRRVGHSERTVRLIVPEKYPHLAYGLVRLQLPPTKKVEKPSYYILIFTDEAFEANKSKPLPEKDITIRIAFLEKRAVKIVRNSIYFGEVKKGIFTFEDWFAKKRGGIFLHAGCREDYLQQVDGSYKTVISLITALSANGKTTLTCKILARKEKERSWLIQDDGGTLYPSGVFEGFEGGGIYVKTESIRPGEQMEVYYGLLKPATLLENVYVTEDNDFDFFNLTRTSNGRALAKRSDFMHASPYINVPRIDNLLLVTRGTLIPAISKLTLEQAVALTIIGMAQETSAGDPTQAGKIRSEFFYDPFVAGSRTEHANRFYEICKGLPDLNFYLLNTGGIGEGIRYKDITVQHTVSILDSLFRGGLKRTEDWIDSALSLKVPVAVRGVDDIYLHPEKLYLKEKFEEKKTELLQRYRKIIQKLGDKLHPEIRNVF
ncbi:hypothetical protein AMJ49_04600 [Parcubacteria bacterium DG_74_2]|nr:MAG: hypothetical protein AMJ49_04600 [Parcubacteria bacterium DG_74_2]